MNEIDPYSSSNWKLGIFYYNPDNPKILVPKRIGIGWTMNFGRWQSIFIIGIFVLVILTQVFFYK